MHFERYFRPKQPYDGILVFILQLLTTRSFLALRNTERHNWRPLKITFDIVSIQMFIFRLYIVTLIFKENHKRVW